MTTEELRRINAKIGYHIFGWRWFRNKKTGLCGMQPPEEGGWYRTPWGSDAYEPVEGFPPKEQQYLDWDKGGARDLPKSRTQYGLPDFSTDMTAAWEVVEKLTGAEERTLDILRNYPDGESSGKRWSCYFLPGGGEHAETAPLAICLAALRAMKVEV